MDTVNRAPSDHSWIQMYNISFNISVKYDSLNFPFSLQTTVPGLTIMLGDWKETLLRGGLLWLHFIVDQSCATFHTSQRTMGKSTCIQGWSSFTIPWKINNFQIKKNHSKHNSTRPEFPKCGPSSPVESDFSESSSTWIFFCHFLSPPSLHRIHGRGHRPRHSTRNCQHRKYTSVLKHMSEGETCTRSEYTEYYMISLPKTHKHYYTFSHLPPVLSRQV